MEDFDEKEFVASEHDRLISAISKLDKTQHIKEPTRSEATNLSSEFNLIKRSTKLDSVLENVVKVLKDTAHHVQVGKKLKKSQDRAKILPTPLEKPQAERIKRATGYDGTKKRIGRWDPVVARSRTVDYVSFPLKHVSSKLQPTEEFITKFTLKSELEKELDELDPPLPEEQGEEEEPLYPMSYEEMIEHRQQIAKLRAQQSYKAAKAKRQSKIKSKKYHRILKKERLKQELKEFEELQKTDPEEALKKLEALEKARALERHTLRHKNTGKWAKSKLVRAKYDKEVRQQLAEQLSVSRGLTHKTQDTESTDDEAEPNEAMHNVSLSQDPLNPWMLKRSDKSNVDAEFNFGYKKYIKGKMYKRDDESDGESDKDNIADESQLDNLKKGIQKLITDYSDDDEVNDNDLNKEVDKNKINNVNKPALEKKRQISPKVELITKKRKVVVEKPSAKNEKVSKAKIKLVATSDWLVEPINENNGIKTKLKGNIVDAFDSFENNIVDIVEKKLKKLRKNIEILENKPTPGKSEEKVKEKKDNLEYLALKQQKVKAIIDEELIETNSNALPNENKSLDSVLNTIQTQVKGQEPTDSDIDPSRFIEVKPKYLNTALSKGENGFDQLDDDEQVVPRVNIEEVFEEDDVVDSFRKEKEDEINKDKPQDIDLSLPGWGSWGGKGVKAPKRKRNRFILKAPVKVPRRDENKGDIIIKEYKEPKLASHKLTDVPFPFSSVKEYEASIRAPIGNTFIPEKAHKKLIRPGVITKAGAIIEPMDEEELLIKKHRKFRNIDVISLLGQK